MSETLYRPESQLTNKKLVQIVVFTLRPNGWREESGLYKSAEDTQQEHKGNVRKGNVKEAAIKGQINKSSKVQEKLAGGETDSKQNKNNVDKCVMGNSVNEKTNNTCVKCGGLRNDLLQTGESRYSEKDKLVTDERQDLNDGEKKNIVHVLICIQKLLQTMQMTPQALVEARILPRVILPMINSDSL